MQPTLGKLLTDKLDAWTSIMRPMLNGRLNRFTPRQFRDGKIVRKLSVNSLWNRVCTYIRRA